MCYPCPRSELLPMSPVAHPPCDDWRPCLPTKSESRTEHALAPTVSRAVSEALSSFRCDARLQLGIVHQVGIHRAQLLADLLLDLHGVGARAFADAVDLDDGVDVLDHGDALLVGRRDNDLQPELLVEAHHLALVLAVHLR